MFWGKNYGLNWYNLKTIQSGFISNCTEFGIIKIEIEQQKEASTSLHILPQTSRSLFPHKLIFFAKGGEFLLSAVGGKFYKYIQSFFQFFEFLFLKIFDPGGQCSPRALWRKKKAGVMGSAQAARRSKKDTQFLLFARVPSRLAEKIKILVFYLFPFDTDRTAAFRTPRAFSFKTGDSVFKNIAAQDSHGKAVAK